MSQKENVIIQVRARLNAKSIKLWLEPYYFEGVGTVEAALDELAADFSNHLGISASKCKLALSELQNGALRKLAARKQFEETGLATFSIRRVNNTEGTQSVLEVQCALNALAADLQEVIANALKLGSPVDSTRIKCIASGKILDSMRTLEEQGCKNNQQLMVIISEIDDQSKEVLYDRIHKIKMDVEQIVDSGRQLFEMEDQDGNPVFLPPDENRALLMAMSFCEKARVAMKRLHYDEALILLLEADEKFTACNSRFLETVDNYALVNLDIVWCYLCLKNVTQLPDAQRRLEICERSFNRSYGEDMHRLIALKGTSCPERALLMRLHLLQGVVLFHQNQRQLAYEKLEIAAKELNVLKVDDVSVQKLMDMGYESFDARLGLRAAGGNISEAVNFIHDRNEKLEQARRRTQREREIGRELARNNNKDWVHPRSVCTLMEMGFQRELVVEALKLGKNDVAIALNLLQTRLDEIRKNLPPISKADDDLLRQLIELGFDENTARIALETTQNDVDGSVQFLIELFGDERELQETIERIALQAIDLNQLPSTSNTSDSLIQKVMDKAKSEVESLEAYRRFNEDLNVNELDYLDLPLDQEEQFLAEYRRLLEE